MFDPKKAALLILSKGGHDEPDGDEGSEDGSGGPEALKAAFEAMQKGDFDVAYDAFRVAVQSCGSDDYEE